MVKGEPGSTSEPGSKRVSSRKAISRSASQSKAKNKRARAGYDKHSINFKVSLYRVLKRVHPDFAVSAKGMSVMNSLIVDLFYRLMEGAVSLIRAKNTGVKYSRRARTLRALDVQSSTRLLLPFELSKQAVLEASKAVNKYGAASE